MSQSNQSEDQTDDKATLLKADSVIVLRKSDNTSVLILKEDFGGAYGEAMGNADSDVQELVGSLRESIMSILQDQQVQDKEQMLDQAFQEFYQMLMQVLGGSEGDEEQGIEADEGYMSKCLAIGALLGSEVRDDDIQKFVEMPAGEDESDPAQAGGDGTGAETGSKSADADVTKHQETDMSKQDVAVPEAVSKALAESTEQLKKAQAQLDAQAVTIAELQKSLTTRDENDALAIVKADLERVGQSADLAPGLLTLRKNDATSYDAVIASYAVTSEKLKKSAMFNELGTRSTVGGKTSNGSAVIAKGADAVRAADPKLTPQQAFAKSYTDEEYAAYKRDRQNA